MFYICHFLSIEYIFPSSTGIFFKYLLVIRPILKYGKTGSVVTQLPVFLLGDIGSIKQPERREARLRRASHFHFQ
jgi:hypothetical protein